MNYKKQLDELTQQIIDNLTSIKDRPEDWLPHIVYVEEEGEDHNGFGIPVYNQYKLVEIQPNGECILMDTITNETEERYLSEINIDWLVTVLNWYNELTGVKIVEPIQSKSEELYAFIYSIDKLNRNASDAEITENWHNDVSGSEIERMTPDEFAERVNDDAFNDLEYWVKFIKM